MHVVWFKKDLRVQDHAPLFDAIERASVEGVPVLPLYVVEPGLWAEPDASRRHWNFIREGLVELRAALAERGQPLVVRVGDVTEVLADFLANGTLNGLWSHEETGNAWTYARDIKVGAWAREARVPWTEVRQTGVIRRLGDRAGWGGRWDRFMGEPQTPCIGELTPISDLPVGVIPGADHFGREEGACPGRQSGGRHTALEDLNGFLSARGGKYHLQMSSPNTAVTGCSRLSAHLMAGTLSLKEVTQATWIRQREVKLDGATTWRRALSAFSGRLHWHCHFMQKLEDAPEHEFKNVHSGYDGLREGVFDERLFQAWAMGRTGLPFVDACMRSLNQTGWINFRMRAMLMAVASYHLWLHWRETGLHLARMFTDYEPGIHWNQVQMQSGTTGINTVRIYNPVKQSLDQDPDGTFIRRWVPELARVPTPFIHEPWKMSPLEQDETGVRIGTEYPEPVVDHLAAARSAREKIYAIRKSDAFRAQAEAIQARHGSRKSGLPQTTRRRRKKASQAQMSLALGDD